MLGAGQHIVLIGRLSATLDLPALLVERCLLIDVVLVAMQLGDVGCYLHALGVDPWALTDAILRVHPTRALRREVGVPCLATRACGGGEALAMLVGAGKPAKVAAIAKGLGTPLKMPDIRRLYDALAMDLDGTINDTDIKSPEGFDKTVRTKMLALSK